MGRKQSSICTFYGRIRRLICTFYGRTLTKSFPPFLFKNFPHNILILEKHTRNRQPYFFTNTDTTRADHRIYIKAVVTSPSNPNFTTNAKKSNFPSFFFTSHTRGTAPSSFTCYRRHARRYPNCRLLRRRYE